MIAWGALVGMNVGILFAVNFTDLTIGMLMIHLFTYDPSWFSIRLRSSDEFCAVATT